jgi:hypothetical protein
LLLVRLLCCRRTHLLAPLMLLSCCPVVAICCLLFSVSSRYSLYLLLLFYQLTQSAIFSYFSNCTEFHRPLQAILPAMTRQTGLTFFCPAPTFMFVHPGAPRCMGAGVEVRFNHSAACRHTGARPKTGRQACPRVASPGQQRPQAYLRAEAWQLRCALPCPLFMPEPAGNALLRQPSYYGCKMFSQQSHNTSTSGVLAMQDIPVAFGGLH